MATLKWEDIPQFKAVPMPSMVLCHEDDMAELVQEISGLATWDDVMIRAASVCERGQVYWINIPDWPTQRLGRRG